jgi:homoserine O-acetyltransferase
VHAQDGRQQFASLGDFHLESGEVIRDCRIGYRTWGKLNAARSNAVVFPTWFSGTTEQLASNFGRGTMLDPAEWYIIAVDALGDGISTSPSNSASQPRMKFPRFTIRDMVESRHQMLTSSLGLNHLHAVMGISMGGMQTFQWMVAYPNFLDRAIPIVGTTRMTPYDTLLWEAERHAIEADAAWKNGDYKERPVAAMRTVSDIHKLALSTPANYVEQNHAKDMQTVLAADEKSTLEDMDTNDWYHQLEAMLTHDIFRGFQDDINRAAAAVKARVTIIVAAQDHMVNPLPAKEFGKALKATIVELSGDCGHLAPGCEATKVNAAVAAALK